MRGGVNSNNLWNEVFQLSDDNQLSVSDVTADKKLTEAYRKLAKTSLYFLTKCVLGYDKLERDVHLPICNFVQDIQSNLRTLLLLPRGTFKSTISTIGFAIYMLLNFPNYFILIANQTDSGATRFLLEIEQHFEGRNQMINWLFPEYVKPGDRYKPWSEDRMVVPCRNIISGTPSITIIGVGGRAESPHYDVIIPDDLIGEKAEESDSEMAKAIAWHDAMDPLFKSPVHGIERMSGTHWSGSDLYCHVKKSKKYGVYWKPARNQETNELFFPSLLPHSFLDDVKARKFKVYIHQYQNDPSKSDALDFKREWLRYFKLVQIDGEPHVMLDNETYPVSEMDVVIAVDPAASGDAAQNAGIVKKLGRSVLANNSIVVAAMDREGRVFILDVWFGRAVGKNPEKQCAEQMIQMCRAWKGYFRVMMLESYGAQAAFMTIFNMLCEQTKEYFRIEPTDKGMQKSKKVRIRTVLGDCAESGNLYIRYSHDKFESEFMNFPSGTVDVIDAATWAIYYLRKPQFEWEEEMGKEELERELENRRKCIGRAGY